MGTVQHQHIQGATNENNVCIQIWCQNISQGVEWPKLTPRCWLILTHQLYLCVLKKSISGHMNYSWAHIEKSVWAHDPNLGKVLIAPTLHKPWPLSCRGMRKVMTWWDHWNVIQSYKTFTRFNVETGPKYSETCIKRPLSVAVSQDRWSVTTGIINMIFLKTLPDKCWNLCVFSKTFPVSLYRFHCSIQKQAKGKPVVDWSTIVHYFRIHQWAQFERETGNLGAVSMRKTVLPGMVIPMLKIRRPNGRLIFNMEIAIRR